MDPSLGDEFAPSPPHPTPSPQLPNTVHSSVADQRDEKVRMLSTGGGGGGGGGGGFLLECEDFWRMFDISFPACVFFYFPFSFNGN